MTVCKVLNTLVVQRRWWLKDLQKRLEVLPANPLQCCLCKKTLKKVSARLRARGLDCGHHHMGGCKMLANKGAGRSDWNVLSCDEESHEATFEKRRR